MSERRAKQEKFSVMLAWLILDAKALGYGITLGEAWRPADVAALYARQGRGIANSLHCDRLAIDLNIFKAEKLLNTFEEIEPIGLIWEKLGGSWGGRFGDFGHFSLQYQGRK